MNKRLIAFLSILSLILTLPTFPVNAAPKKVVIKEGAGCKVFGQVSKKLQCVSVNRKNIWQELTLTEGSKIYPNEGSECFRENVIVLGKLLTSELDKLECVWDNGIIGSKAFTMRQLLISLFSCGLLVMPAREFRQVYAPSI